ncbi:hypothetical protein FSARC_13303 [Fusarium sarcochroum]|uniref:Uncharacterized protein n=1 Tax=Fusarium sarcochroum TaxID=1208366 RepID=A0A8H4T2I2_9HYPO|nr:hypothetical protein FSARC_13303 [Fusarium sarcochroum]
MSSDQNQEATPPNNRDSSPAERLYTTATPIRFAPRGTRNTIIDSNVVMLDPRNVQQWQLDATEARIAETATNISDCKRRIDVMEEAQVLSSEILHEEFELLRDDMDDLKLARQKKAQGGCFPWKSLALVIIAIVGIAVMNSYEYDQQTLFDLLDYSLYI